MPDQAPTPREKKLAAYLEELTELNTRYQFKLVPFLVNRPDGISPQVRIEDVLPPPKPPADTNPGKKQEEKPVDNPPKHEA